MASEPIYKVFVSSTFLDLREERAEVQKALLKLNCLPVGMELFPAADDDTWEFIKEQINDSDYYVVLSQVGTGASLKMALASQKKNMIMLGNGKYLLSVSFTPTEQKYHLARRTVIQRSWRNWTPL
jgi:Domain of unknown function (DUF4062)